jgi:hypothetical protein
MHTPAMTRKPLTQEQAFARWHREAANVQRIIDEGKALNSVAAKLYPRHRRQIGSAPTVQQQQSAPNSIASRLWPKER